MTGVQTCALPISLHESLKSYEELKKQKISVSVVDIYCVKPFDSKKFDKFIKKHGNKLIIVEDHHYEGGIGEMLISGLKNSGVKIKHLAVSGIPHSGTKEELLNKYGINWKNIIVTVKKFNFN